MDATRNVSNKTMGNKKTAFTDQTMSVPISEEGTKFSNLTDVQTIMRQE